MIIITAKKKKKDHHDDNNNNNINKIKTRNEKMQMIITIMIMHKQQN